MKLELYYPARPYSVNQKFGFNNSCIEDNGLPTAKRKVITKLGKTCPVGYIELYPYLGMKGHTGLDLLALDGVPLYHCGPDGIVEEISTEVERGLGVGVVSDDFFSTKDTSSSQVKLRYWHLKSIAVKKGQKIKTGDLVGYADSTGLSSGSHLHLELKQVYWSGTEYLNKYQNNGYFGAEDPEPYFNGKYADEFLKLYGTIVALLQKLVTALAKRK